MKRMAKEENKEVPAQEEEKDFKIQDELSKLPKLPGFI